MKFETSMGLRVRVNNFVRDTPKLKFDTTSLGFSTPAINEFNKWLEERFGMHHCFILFENEIHCSEKGFEAINKACKVTKFWRL